MISRFTIVGSGNIASWFAYVIHKNGGKIEQIFSRKLKNAQALASLYQSEATDKIECLKQDSDVYLFAINDNAYLSVLEMLTFKPQLAVHTAGSVSQHIFDGYAERYGVIYPYQSISKNADFSDILVPLCIESSDEETENQLFQLGKVWADDVALIDECQRAYLHLAAVFACNFVNAMYGIGYDILEKENINPNILWPLLENTLNKIKEISPIEAQTGPAMRNEQITMKKHLDLLDDEALKEIYSIISKRIIKQTLSR